ncbi:MAG: tryptophan 2,3-dioxygenase family protein [Rhodothermales bacterium]|nr:tryptophan 2,3-dioxygenase family protein [Rhodothermales bacterium]MDG2015845.1 tryptophan 2,3-dioxygenase family protein [Rhodothermales bacterium]HAY35718.1 tryptophan 2,3-dioxygenase [Bacteroidota bacterium]
MSGKPKGLYYGDYLQLETILGAQDLKSGNKGDPAHDEMLFIIIHQTYELWFKQVLWEIDGVVRLLNREAVEEGDLGKVVSHLERIIEIQRVLIQQINILETMTPLDFLDFRDELIPASGFQSAQWRIVENKMGMRPHDRHAFTKTKYTSRYSDTDRHKVEATEESPSLFDLVESWLERTPFIQVGMFDFWESYKEAVDRMLSSDADHIQTNPTLTKDEKTAQMKNLDGTRTHFSALFSAEKYADLLASKEVRLSHRALQAALLIQLYRDEPILHLPFRLLQALVDIDENFTNWRYRHALMAKRMIGTKIGTGGSSGGEYLRKAAEHNRVFGDLNNLTTFFIPRSELPKLPENVRQKLGFHWHPDRA